MRGVELVDVDIHGEIWNVMINGVDVGAAGRSRARPALSRPGQDAPDRPGRLPRGVGRHRAAVGRDRRAGPPPRPGAAARVGRRRVVVHRDAAPPGRSPPTPGSGGRSSATRRRGIRWTCRGTRCPTRRACRATATHARRSTRCSRCAATGWPRCARCVDGLTDEHAATRTPCRSTRARAGRSRRSYPVRECLLIVLNEEWEHRLYAERDLAALEARGS